MWLFYLFAALLILQGLISLRAGWRWLAYFRRELARPLPGYAPLASVIVPCRGLDQGLAENLRALCAQDYPRYEIIFVTDSTADPALSVIEAARAIDNGTTTRAFDSRVIIAGPARDCG